MMSDVRKAAAIRGFVAFLLALLAVLAVPLAARAATDGVSVAVSGLQLSARSVSPGQTVTFSLKITEPANVEAAYVYLRATDGSQQQVSLADDDGNGVFRGDLTVDGRWTNGSWKCAAIQVRTANKQWGYLRDKRFYDQGKGNLAAFDLTVKGSGGDTEGPQILMSGSQAVYRDGTQHVTVKATDVSGVEYLCVYYVAPDGSDLQVKLSAVGEGDLFEGSFSCVGAQAGDVWRCKAIQTCDAVGNWRYAYDKRYKPSSTSNLSRLDAVVCQHQWSDWEEVRASTCMKEGARQRTCSVCQRVDEQPMPLSEHLWVGVATDIKPTVTEPGVGHYVCAWCNGSRAIELPALGPYSAYEYLPGVYLVRYYPETPAQGRVTFRGQDMYWVQGENCWAVLAKGDQGELAAGDFVDSAALKPLETVVRSGDLNENGEVNIVDVQVCYDLVTGVYRGTERIPMRIWLAADVNNDGFLDAADAFALQKRVM